MSEFWQKLVQATESLHPAKLKVLSENIGRLDSCRGFPTIVEDFGNRELRALETAWFENPNITPAEVSSAILVSAIAKEAKNKESVELVWTGPDTTLVPSRDTRQVIEQVIGSAQKSLFLVSYVLYRVDGVLDSLAEAISRGIEVSVLLESPESSGGNVSQDGLSELKRAVPQAKIYVWNPSDREVRASVHAKCVVADDTLAFITSANLTSAALDRNMELGVLFRGGPTPKTLKAHLNALVTTKVVSLADF
jgi:cardiolipin synthase